MVSAVGTAQSIAGDRPVLVTGAAGFIGFHVAKRYLEAGIRVVGLDVVNDYYDPSLKEARLGILRGYGEFRFIRGDLADQPAVDAVFGEHRPNLVVSLAAQVGVRNSMEHPRSYTRSNIDGFLNVLEACRRFGVRHLVYASSSSVYGLNARVPFSEEDGVDHPVSLYAASKRANELMAHAYAHQFGFPVTGLRFFTVYGPYGRPDMAYFAFTKGILDGSPITVYRNGTLERDFTYVDDIVEAVVRIGELPATAEPGFDPGTAGPAASSAPFRIYNVGNHKRETVNALIAAIERATDARAIRIERPMPRGDVEKTFADVDRLVEQIGFSPSTPLDVGIERFVEWYRRYYET